MVIYKITNNINGKAYIGQTIQDVQKRWKEHCKKCKSKVSAISDAIQRYGKDNFTFEIIEDYIMDIEVFNLLEKHYIEKFNTLAPKGYNLTTGGLNYIVSKETKNKMREASLGKELSEETKQKIKDSKKHIVYSVTSLYKQKLGKLLSNLHEKSGAGVRFNKKDNAYQAYIYVDGKIKTKTFTISILGEAAKSLASQYRILLEKETITYYKLKIENNA